MKRKLWTLLLALGAALALCVGAGAAEVSVTQANQLIGDSVELNGEYKLIADITIDRSIVIKKEKSVTLDLNGHVLQYKNDSTKGSVIKVEGGGHLTIQDSNTGSLSHKFTPNSDGLWVLDEASGTEEVKGGVITGGTGTQWDQYYRGGGVYVAPGGTLTMESGSIVGCSANGSSFSLGGGVYIDSSANSNADTFTMNGGSIIGCTADGGGGVLVALECHFTMNTGAVIRSCTAQMGGGVYCLGMSGSFGIFTLNGGTIQSCKALGRGGGGVSNSGEFLMQNGLIENCASVKDSNASGGVLNSSQFTMSGGTVESSITNSGTINADGGTVTDSRGDAITLTDKGDGRYTFTMPARRVEVKASFVKSVEVSPFADVAIDAYYYEAVKWAAENGITGGVGNSLFAPNQPCTRGQIVTFLWRAAGSPVVNYAMNMTDVAEDAYYGEAVRWALSEGITTGTGKSSFSPDATCTRAQAVTFLARALNANASGKAEFGDVPTDSYFAEAVAWAAANGVTEGVGGGLFGSDNSCTRGQIVTFLYRAYNK